MRAALLALSLVMIALVPAASAAEGTKLGVLGIEVSLPLQLPLVRDTDIQVHPLGIDLLDAHVDGSGAVRPLGTGDALAPTAGTATTTGSSAGGNAVASGPAAGDSPLGADGGGVLGLLLVLALAALAIVIAVALTGRARDRAAWGRERQRYAQRIEAEHRRLAQQRAVQHAGAIEEARRPAVVAAPAVAQPPAVPARPAQGPPDRAAPAGVEGPGAAKSFPLAQRLRGAQEAREGHTR